MKIALSKLLRNEKGQALPIVLILLLIGGIIAAPLLTHMGTGIKAGQVHETKMEELYAADSGIEDALWQVKNDQLETLFPDPNGYDLYNYSDNWSYILHDEEGEVKVNDKTVNVSIKNIWIPKDIDEPGATEAENIIGNAKLVVSGSASGATTYKIKIGYVPGAGEDLRVETIGIWLPPGFSYVSGSSNLEQDDDDPYYPDSVDVTPYASGYAVVWNFSSVPFVDFPGIDLGDPVWETEITFQFTPSEPGQLPDALAWITTSGVGVSDIPYSWDADVKVYRLNSTAGSTEIEAYSIKSELRKLSAAIAGDYRAIGNSLMARSSPSIRYRNILLPESSAEVDDIPENAQVVAAYLYWSGWFEEGTTTTIFSDDCNDFTAPPMDWTRSGPGGGSQTRVPTADGDTRGFWNTSPCWDDVDETTPNDADYMTGTTVASGSAYQLFTFSPFTIPAGSSITDLTVYVRASDAGASGTGNIRPSIKVDGNRYNTTAPINNPGGSFTTYWYSYTTNPDTWSPWTAEDINGSGPDALQQFGVYSTDLDPDIQVSMVYAVVNYGSSSRWTISSGEFRGQGSGTATAEERTLTMGSSLDLSSYAPGTVSVSWEQDASWEVDSTDYFYFAFYNSDDGWSSNIVAFGDDNPDSPFTYTIPDAYLTDDFKMRFYFNFNSTDEYVYIDNVEIVESVLAADTTAIFKIDDTQVSFDGDGNPQLDGELTADSYQVIDNTNYGNPHGYSYASFKDVTDLILAFTEEGPNENYPGNADYTVGSVDATRDAVDEWAYAGWSLIIIYSSLETKGHQLYLYDTFLYKDHNDEFLDFDQDGEEGGTISGFFVPRPVEGEVNAAKITAFVGEGDIWYEGDYLRFNGTKLDDGTGGGVDNVWNGQSIGMSAEGIDVDTFYITWESELLEPGATQAQIDMWTETDIWNLVYIILSFRSATTTGGTMTYLIK